MRVPAAGDVAALVRLPAVLSVPGDALLGAALAGRRGPRVLLVPAASASLYLAGMALNDWADRDEDAVDRPSRPIPSGRVSPPFALSLSACLTALGLGLAGLAGGRGALVVAGPLAGAVWAYDLALKGTRAGPAAMAACRALDVLLGAGASGGRLRAALPGAAVVGTHTTVVSALSRHEVAGGTAAVARRAAWATTAVTVMAAGLARRRRRPGRSALRTALTLTSLGGYEVLLARAQWRAAHDPTPVSFQRAVGTGVLGLMPLEAGLLAATGPLPAALAVGAAWPVAIRLARRRPVT